MADCGFTAERRRTPAKSDHCDQHATGQGHSAGVARWAWLSTQAGRNRVLSRARLCLMVTADFGAVERRKTKKAQGGYQRQKGDQKEGESEVADRQCCRASDQRQQGGADRNAEASRQLLSNAADTGALAQLCARNVRIADRIEAKILDTAHAARQQNEKD